MPFKTTISTVVLLSSVHLVHGADVTRTIQTDNNDAEEHLNDPVFSGQSETRGALESLASSDLETSEQMGGLDWQGIGVQWDQLGIAQGSVINQATVTFTIDAVNPPVIGGSTAFTLFAEAVDNSADFAAVDFNISSRDRTAASVAWDASVVPVPEVEGSTVEIDVTPLVQEVVNRVGWSANNQLSILLFPDVYLANPDGAALPIRVLEFEAGPGDDSATLSVNFVPEPNSLALLAIGGLAVLRRRR